MKMKEELSPETTADAKEASSAVETVVMRTGFLCEIGGTKTFVIADNVASAMDCLDRTSNGEDYSMLIHHSIPAILDA
jgi:hypothetical protein